MKRVIIICEGQTEKEFCSKTLGAYFAEKECYIHSPLIKASHGGIVKWTELKKQIEMHLKTEKDVFVTTFIDYYGLYRKHNFPNWDNAEKIIDKNQRMDALEKAMKDDIVDKYRNRFIPYLQLHEFEGLLFNEIDIFRQQIPPGDLVGISELEQIFEKFDNPEMINDNPDTSPSHRLERIINGYKKVVYGNILAEAIGLHRIRQKSPRFNQWMITLEQL